MLSMLIAVSGLLSTGDAFALICEPYNTRISNEFSGPYQAAKASGDTCKLTRIYIEELQEMQKLASKCYKGRDKKSFLDLIDLKIAVDEDSLVGKCS